MDLKQLRNFVQIVECGSFSRAAELLRLSQPSLSIQVGELEKELAVELLVRHPRGVKPTELGLVFCDHARKILREAQRAKELIRSQAVSPVGKVLVGLPTSACRGLTLPLYEAVGQRFPGVTLHLVEALSGSLDEWIHAGRLDIALLYENKADDRMDWTEVIVERIRAVVAPALAAEYHAGLPFRALSGLPVVLPGRSHVLRTILEQVAIRHHMTLNVAIECDSLSAMRELVKAGYITLLPEFAVGDEIRRGEMVAVPVVNPARAERLQLPGPGPQACGHGALPR